MRLTTFSSIFSRLFDKSLMRQSFRPQTLHLGLVAWRLCVNFWNIFSDTIANKGFTKASCILKNLSNNLNCGASSKNYGRSSWRSTQDQKMVKKLNGFWRIFSGLLGLRNFRDRFRLWFEFSIFTDWGKKRNFWVKNKRFADSLISGFIQCWPSFG